MPRSLKLPHRAKLRGFARLLSAPVRPGFHKFILFRSPHPTTIPTSGGFTPSETSQTADYGGRAVRLPASDHGDCCSRFTGCHLLHLVTLLPHTQGGRVNSQHHLILLFIIMPQVCTRVSYILINIQDDLMADCPVFSLGFSVPLAYRR